MTSPRFMIPLLFAGSLVLIIGFCLFEPQDICKDAFCDGPVMLQETSQAGN